LCFFFFQAEDGIRDIGVTGVRRVLFRSWRFVSWCMSTWMAWKQVWWKYVSHI